VHSQFSGNAVASDARLGVMSRYL